MIRELKHSLRNLAKAPGFTLTATLTLALGIGASTAVFTVVDSVILNPLTYRDSGRLVVIWERVKFLVTSSTPYSGPNPRHEAVWKQRSEDFSELSLVGVGARGVSLGVDHPQLVGSIRAQQNLLHLLKVTPILGRNFTAEENIEGHDHVAIVSYFLWQNLFHGDSNVLGKTLRVSGKPYQVVGVMPADFRFPKKSVLNAFPSQRQSTTPEIQILTPLPIDPDKFGWNSDYGNLLALGRLKPGTTPRQAEAHLNVIERQIVNGMSASEHDGDPDALLAYVQPMQDAVVGNSRRALWMLMASVVGLMLIACVNLASAQLGRAVFRAREAAVCSALGASKWQLVWSSLSETLLLSFAGGVGGILLASNAIAFFKRYAPVDLPRMNEIQLNVSVLCFAALLVTGAGLLFGILPAIKLVRTDPHLALQQNNARSQGSRRGRLLRLALIGIQVFGCTALLLVTGLFTKSLFTLLTNDRGFDTNHVVTAQVSLPAEYANKDQSRIAFYEGVLARLHAIPGVKYAAAVSAMPLEGESWIDGIERADAGNRRSPISNFRWVSAEYFQVIREPLVAGRFFEERDRDTKNAVISEAAARAAWPGENPVGRQMIWRQKRYTVIGVVADARTNGLKVPPVNMVYLPYRTLDESLSVFMLRSDGAPEAFTNEIRLAIWSQDPSVTIARVTTLNSQVDASLASERFQTAVLAAFGAAALLLAMLGVYGILSYITASRVKEIGVRVALGATRRMVYQLTMSDAAIPVIGGLIAGWMASLVAGKLVQNLLYRVTSTDWPVAIAVAAMLLCCASAAAFLPARRAAAVDPMQALRME